MLKEWCRLWSKGHGLFKGLRRGLDPMLKVTGSPANPGVKWAWVGLAGSAKTSHGVVPEVFLS